MKLTSLKLTPKESKAELKEMTEPEAPEYGWGTRLCLDDETLAKLGIETPPPVGTIVTITARAEVVSASQYANKEGKQSSCDLQLTDMAVDGDKPPASERLYGGKA